jgi:uncharacterized damage-inducible protein DinB
MDTKQAILSSLTQADFVVDAYLKDLTTAELLVRPVPGANHIAWQLGHLISSERYFLEKLAPGTIAALPPGFDAAHNKETAASDDPQAFLSKEEYVQLSKQMRGETLRLLAAMTPEDLDRPVQKMPPVVKVNGDVFLFVGMHWLMHTGQWAITRRKIGRPPLF